MRRERRYAAGAMILVLLMVLAVFQGGRLADAHDSEQYIAQLRADVNRTLTPGTSYDTVKQFFDERRIGNWFTEQDRTLRAYKSGLKTLNLSGTDVQVIVVFDQEMKVQSVEFHRFDLGLI